jgi:hypothetical protein
MSSAFFDRPTLTGRYVRLEPLAMQHAEGLLEAGKDPDVWTWLSTRQPTDLAAMRAYVERLLIRTGTAGVVTRPSRSRSPPSPGGSAMSG